MGYEWVSTEFGLDEYRIFLINLKEMWDIQFFEERQIYRSQFVE